MPCSCQIVVMQKKKRKQISKALLCTIMHVIAIERQECAISFCPQRSRRRALESDLDKKFLHWEKVTTTMLVCFKHFTRDNLFPPGEFVSHCFVFIYGKYLAVVSNYGVHIVYSQRL